MLRKTDERYAIASNIVEIGWNDDFIVVESKMTNHEWMIIVVVSTGKTYHCDENTPFVDECNSFEEFLLLKDEVGVPETLIMRDVHQVYEELNQK